MKEGGRAIEPDGGDGCDGHRRPESEEAEEADPEVSQPNRSREKEGRSKDGAEE